VGDVVLLPLLLFLSLLSLLVVRPSRLALKSRIFQVIYVGWNCCHQYFWPCCPLIFRLAPCLCIYFILFFCFGCFSVFVFVFALRMKCVFWPLYVRVVLFFSLWQACCNTASQFAYCFSCSSLSQVQRNVHNVTGFLSWLLSGSESALAKFGSAPVAKVQNCTPPSCNHTPSFSLFLSSPSLSLTRTHWYFTWKTFQQLSDSCKGYGYGHWYCNFCRVVVLSVASMPTLLLLLLLVVCGELSCDHWNSTWVNRLISVCATWGGISNALKKNHLA